MSNCSHIYIEENVYITARSKCDRMYKTFFLKQIDRTLQHANTKWH
jgi:hypothetical protein